MRMVVLCSYFDSEICVVGDFDVPSHDSINVKSMIKVLFCVSYCHVS